MTAVQLTISYRGCKVTGIKIGLMSAPHASRLILVASKCKCDMGLYMSHPCTGEVLLIPCHHVC